MSELKLEFVGKQVKDMYDTLMGRVVGVLTDTDGSIESVSVDCGSVGIKQLAYEQLLVQGNYVIYIPRWRLDAQKLLRQKNLALKRIKALRDIVTENDLMKEDAELISIKYEKKLHDLEESEKAINEQLQIRIGELDTEGKNIRSILFDAKLQYRSNEITEETYQQINIYSNELMEHINREKTEINNVKTRLTQQVTENVSLLNTTNNNATSDLKVQESRPATDIDLTPPLESQDEEDVSTIQNLPAPEIMNANTQSTVGKNDTPTTNNNNTNNKVEIDSRESSWLNRVIHSEMSDT
ncbi:MAG TPA: CdvA-like protein [Nitrososphaeraceae archaeon]|jgi:hypothetical protein|nr:CdvA-like protein [Nitrososphaeraceae archaeon]